MYQSRAVGRVYRDALTPVGPGVSINAAVSLIERLVEALVKVTGAASNHLDNI